jgi:multidrug resistance protein, MATE family
MTASIAQTPPDAPVTRAAAMRRLLALGLPLVGSQLAGFAMHMTDTILLGWYAVTSLAASTIAVSLFFNLWILGAGFGNAVMGMTANAVAAGDSLRARRIARMAMWLSFGFALLTIWPLWQSERILLAIGQKPEVAAEAQTFLRIMMWAMFPMLVQNVLRSYLAAQGRTQMLLWVTLGGVVLNAGIAGTLIFGLLGLPELGIRGAAIATLTVQCLITLILGAYAARVMPQAALFRRMWKADLPALGDVFRQGWPIGVTLLCEGSLFSGAAVMMGWIGAQELAAHGIAMQIASLTFMFHLGMAQGSTVLAGAAHGRRDEPALRRTAQAAILVCSLFALIVVLVLVTLPAQVVRLWVDPTDPAAPQVLAVGITLVLMAALFQFVDAMQVVALSLLRGLQDTQVPMWLAVLSYWCIGIPVAYGFGFALDMGPVGIWLGLTAGLLAAAGLLMARFWLRAVRIGGGAAAHV